MNPERLITFMPLGFLVGARETCTYSALLQWHALATYLGVIQPGRQFDTLRFRGRYVVATDIGVNRPARLSSSRLHGIVLRVASLFD